MPTVEEKETGMRYSIQGFAANGVWAGIKEEGKRDLGLIFSDVPASAAGMFTTNRFKAAPVLVNMEKLKSGVAQAIVTNSGIANAATGAAGIRDARAISRTVSDGLRIHDGLVLVNSTGVIGHPLPVKKIRAAVPALIGGLSADGIPLAEEAMMTTDRYPKLVLGKCRIGSAEVSICGIAKGAGMIQPNMATMLTYFMTDAEIRPASLKKAFRWAIDRSFNAISVDGCMSTNDTALILANGKAGNRSISGTSGSFRVFRGALQEAAEELAKAIVRDGEGATKLIEIRVEGARTAADARKAAYAVANSNLVKTAFFGGDANWGRIISALGSTDAAFSPEAVKVYLDREAVFRNGKGIGGREEILSRIMSQVEITLRIVLGAGKESFRLYGSDLSFDYVKINAHYRT